MRKDDVSPLSLHFTPEEKAAAACYASAAALWAGPRSGICVSEESPDPFSSSRGALFGILDQRLQLLDKRDNPGTAARTVMGLHQQVPWCGRPEEPERVIGQVLLQGESPAAGAQVWYVGIIWYKQRVTWNGAEGPLKLAAVRHLSER